jgi:glycosyltransferase involved in cell wall biosynthesis
VAHHRRGPGGRGRADGRGRRRSGDLALSADAGGPPLRLTFVADPNSLHTRRWIAWFADAGHAVQLLDPFGATFTPGFPTNVEVIRVPPVRRTLPVVGLWRRRRQLRHTLREIRPDVVHAHFVRRYGWQAAIAGFHPLVVSPWGSDLLKVRPGQVRTRWWNRYALRAADLVTVSSEGMRTAAVRGGARPERVALVHHGVDTARFSPGEPADELRRRLGLTSTGGARVIVSPRSIRPLYRQLTVVDAVARLASAGHRPLLVMSARGADPDELARVRARAAEGGIGDALRILDDVPHEELHDLFRLADVVVSVPESDSFPVTLLEAMAVGRPVVASDLPAVTPVLRTLDPLAGELIAPVGDDAATARALERALALTDADRGRLGGALRDHVVRTADYDTNMRAMEAHYRRLAASADAATTRP